MLPALLTSYLKKRVEKKFSNPMNLYENLRDDGLLKGLYNFAKDRVEYKFDNLERKIDMITDPFSDKDEEEEEKEKQENQVSNFADIYADLLNYKIPSVGNLYQQQQQMSPFSDLAKDLSFLRPETKFKIGY